MKYDKRYGILYSRKLQSERVLVCIDMKLGRFITFAEHELESEEMEEGLKTFVMGNKDKINSGYFDYSGDLSPKVNTMLQSLEKEKAASSAPY